MGIKEKRVSIYVDLDWLIKAGILKPRDRCEAGAIARAWGVPDEAVIKALPTREPEHLDVPPAAAMDDPCVLHRVHTGLKNL
jgi:hypothetical protein